jgi:TetR/AcrR family transcriptional regulator, cholesterol catabolism regulator
MRQSDRMIATPRKKMAVVSRQSPLVGGPRSGPRAIPDEGRTRNRIITEAAFLFQDIGYASATMRLIARRVGITAGALYWHFAAKEEILRTYLETAVLNIVQAIKPSLEHSTGSAQLRTFVRAHIQEQLKPLNLYGPSLSMRQLARFLPPDQDHRFEGLRREWLDLLKQILRNGIKDGSFRSLDVTPTAYVISTVVDSVVVWYKPTGRLRPDDVASLYEDLVHRMVATTGEAVITGKRSP